MTQPPTWGAPPPQPPGGWPGQPAPGQRGPGGQWGPQQRVPAPVPPKKSGVAKWAIGAVSLVAVIAVTATVAVSCTENSGDSSGGAGGTKTSAVPSDVASANDTGPVGIITEDPSCAPWGPVISTLADVESKGWQARDPAVPATSWSPEVRAQYEAVGNAMRKAADLAVPLAKMTTHRVLRELFEQFIVYSRAYADSVASYTPRDEQLAGVGSTASSVITHVCSAVASGSAAARASLVPKLASPQHVAPVGDVSSPQRIFSTPDQVCPTINSTLDQLLQNPAFKSWLNINAAIPVSGWPPEQQVLTNAVVPVMTSTALALEELASRSSNPVVQDFILLGVQYRRAYIDALPTYQPSDGDIYLAGQYAPGVVALACSS